MTARPDDLDDAAGAIAWADLSLRIETATSAITENYQRWESLYRSLHMVQITAPAVTAGKVIDLPDILGPRNGWCWDVRRLTLDGAGGTVWVYKSLPASTNLMDILPVPGSYRFGKGSWLIQEHERIVFKGGVDLHGAAIVGGDAAQFYSKCLPVYLV